MVTATKRNAAPGELELVRAFLNTAQLERGLDDLEQPADLQRWLVSRELLAASAPVSADDLAIALAVREALRELAAANAGRSPSDAACATLDALSEASGLRPRFERDGTVALAPRSVGVAGGLGPVEDVPQSRLPVGLLRQHPQPLRGVVRHGRLRQPSQGARLLRPPARLRRRLTGHPNRSRRRIRR